MLIQRDIAWQFFGAIKERWEDLRVGEEEEKIGGVLKSRENKIIQDKNK